MSQEVHLPPHPQPTGRPEAWHRTGAGGVLRDVVLGSSDGLVAVLAFIAGVSASLESRRAVLLAGIAEMVAGAMSMGLGAYLATKSEREFYQRELAREKREIRDMPQQETEEIREIYRRKGFSGDDLEMIVDRITQDKERWLLIMMHEELGFTQSVFASPVRAGAIVGVAYIIGSFFPIAPYLVLAPPGALFVSVALTLAVLFGVGAAKTSVTHRKWWRSGLEMAAAGGIGSAICYAISKVIAGI